MTISVSAGRAGIAALAAILSVSAGTGSAMAQEAPPAGGDEEEAPIVISGERPSDPGNRGSRDPERPDEFYAVQQNDEDGTIDWQLLYLLREQNKNSVRDRYGHAGYMAQCALASVGEDAVSYVDVSAEPDYEALMKAFKGRHAQCVNSAQRAAPVYMVNAALAEMLVVNALPQPPLRAEGVDTARAADFVFGPEPESDINTVARCAVVYSPGLAYDVLFTSPDSKEERAALELLYANTPECGLSERPKMEPIYQRTSLAVALFKWNELGPLAASADE
ncbi:hypothetical protein [Sphingomicrobium sediminis]|uniref:Uncharacterized protein n=1 Tax=Sphingomicrobium sediminis TaxID=2950949 RepID=A0A9X2EKG8_9SPHN|nr:hypothetical protein [Sphingomicrobium sediminis]MCM8557027.1 hypothetical protein [Sphingomicrobium sediminis]